MSCGGRQGIKFPSASTKKMMGLETGLVVVRHRCPMHHSLIHNKPTHLKPDYLPTPYLGKKKEQHPTLSKYSPNPRNQEAAEELLRERKYIGKERLGGAFVVR